MRPQELYFLFSDITRLKGVGRSTVQALGRLLVDRSTLHAPEADGALRRTPVIRDLLFHLPVAIIDRRFTCPLPAAPEGVVGTFVVTVKGHVPAPTIPGRRASVRPYKVFCSDGHGDITLVFFHAREDYLRQALPVGAQRVISGRIEKFDFQLQMTHPDFIAPLEELENVRRVEPVYPLTHSISNRKLGRMITQALEKLPQLPEWIGEPTLKTHGWPGWNEALVRVHAPGDQADLLPMHPARARLAYDEMIAYQLTLGMLRKRTQETSAHVIHGGGKLAAALQQSLPFTLTGGQKQVLQEIIGDMGSGQRMARLLQGDVGSGKTVVAVLAMLEVTESGRQSALMAPTEIIARQHAETLRNWLEPLGVRVAYLSGSVKGKERKAVLEAAASGEAAIVVGTHALFQEHVEFHHLALAVIDEQHRFGVGQRLALAAKGDAPHLLHMTATPIPRTLAMMLYGDMDSSQLTEKPPGRTPVDTRVIPLSRQEEVVEALPRALAKGEKIYWICPLIEDGSERAEQGVTAESDLAAAEARFQEFSARFPGKVALVHGRMKSDARMKAMESFATGSARILVATTVVEVGVDVKDATIMIIEQAERFGLSQLHQLRGRVGRSDKRSSCVLLYGQGIRGKGLGIREGENTVLYSPNPQSPMPHPALARLRILRETEDGFRIAEEDLRLRGGGDILGTRQSGLPDFWFVDLGVHAPLVAECHREMRAFLAADPALQSPRGKALELLLEIFGYGEVEQIRREAHVAQAS